MYVATSLLWKMDKYKKVVDKTMEFLRKQDVSFLCTFQKGHEGIVALSGNGGVLRNAIANILHAYKNNIANEGQKNIADIFFDALAAVYSPAQVSQEMAKRVDNILKQ